MPGRDLVEGRGRAIVAALAVTQTVGYGSLWYSFPVLLAPMAADLGASRTAVTGAFTMAALVTAALSVPVGRWLDRRGSHALMTVGSLTGTALLVALSRVGSLPALYLVWGCIGATGAAVFYEAAFATVVAWTPSARRAGRILAITVVAGFASMIFLPLTGGLVHARGWRTAVLVLAAIHGLVTVPLHALVLRRPPHLHATRTDPARRAAAEAARRDVLGLAVRDSRFWLLGVGFTAQAAALATMTVHLVGFLQTAGHPATVAAAISGLLGALSVSGRLVVTVLTRRLSTSGVTAAVFAVQAAAAAALPAIATSTAGAVVAVLGFGIGFGVATLARPALLTTLFGTTGYASLSGRLALPIALVTAGAPLAAATAQQATGSWTPVLLAVAACNALASAAILLAGEAARRRGIARWGE
jgi:MFS family permease